MGRRFFHEYIFQVVVGLAVTGTVATFALIYKYWNWPNAIVGGVLLLCGVLYLMDRLGIGPSAKSRVRDWLDSSGFDVRTIHDSNDFHFVMTDNVGIVTDIWHLNADAPIEIASAKHKPNPAQMSAFHSLTPQQQNEFWRNVRLELLRYGIGFSDLTLEGDGVGFSDSVIVGRTLNATEFLKKVLFVRSGARLYIELLDMLAPLSATQPKALSTAAVSPPTPPPMQA